MQEVTIGKSPLTLTPTPRPVSAVELLHWVYAVQCADRVADAGLHELERRAMGLPVRGRSADGCVAIANRAVLGVDIRGGGLGRGELHIDAERVHAFVVSLVGPVRNLLLRHGRRGDSPDWGAGLVSIWQPEWKAGPRYAGGMPAEGAYRMLYDANRKAIACKVECEHDPVWLDAIRAEYANWHRGLEAVAEAFGEPGALISRKVVKLGAPAAPWLDLRISKM